MSGDLSKKRKDKKKKKAMLEALQAEEYREERAHVQLVDADEEEPVLIPTQDQQEDMIDPEDVTPLINEDEEGSGSGICSTIIFVCLLSALGLAVGVIFFEMGALPGPLSNLANLVDPAEPVTVTVTETETLFVDEQTEPPAVPIQSDESLKEFDEIEETAQSIPQQIVESAPVESEPPAQEAQTPEPEPVIVTEAPVEEIPEIAPEQPEPVVVESQEPTEVESLLEPVAVEQIIEEVASEPVAVEEIIQEAASEPVAVKEIIQEVASEPEVVTEEPVQDAPELLVKKTEEVPSSSNFETELEDEPAEVPLESFTMRAEREAVQEAMDQVWVLAVRCVEELRALQIMSKSQITLAAVDSITQRMEPLRNQLDYLVKSTSENIFDGALEQTADLERNLMSLLEELEQARTRDAVLTEEMAEAIADEPLVELEPTVESEQVSEPTSDPESLPAVPEEEHPVAPDSTEEELKEVDEPIQVATDAFLVQPEEAEVDQAILAEVIALGEQEIADTVAETNLVTEQFTPADAAAVDESLNEGPSVLSESVQEVGESISLEKIEEQIIALTDSEPKSPPAIPDVVQEKIEEEAIKDDSIASINLEEADQLVNEIEEIVAVEQNVATTEDAAAVTAVDESVNAESIVNDFPTQEADIEPISLEPEQIDEPISEPESPPIAINIAEEEAHVPIQVEIESLEKQETKDDLAASLNLEDADRLVDQSPAEALILMEQILERDPSKALALYGRARALDSLAEIEKSNARLEQSIFAYRAILDLEEKVDDILFRRAALRCIDRMRFRGFNSKAIRIQQRLVSRFPNEIQLQNQLAVGFLLANQPESAKSILESVIERWPHGQGSGFAQVHLGFILKTTFGDNDNGARWMAAGISSRDEGVVDGRFYFHLGDAYERIGLHQQAKQIYAEGEREGIFLSRDQRSLYNVDRLTGRPWWDKESSTYKPFFDLLEANWWQIRDEGVALLNLQAPEPVFADEAENLKDTGDWKQFELFSRGRKNVQHCMKAPRTCVLIENFPPALCKRGQVKFSVMHPGTHVWPHTGPTNCRIRSHLGLVVPEGTRLRVGNVTQSWEEGKFIIFDDSFEHEVWHTGSSYRLVLIIDLWHPELTLEERHSLSPI